MHRHGRSGAGADLRGDAHSLATAPADIPKKYALIDRPLADKQRDDGWRGQKGLVDKYHRLFADHAGAALAGDGRDDVEVIDLRMQYIKRTTG
ncbi:hypothetical protein WN73_05795 [Bradyrhizobium sp. CCBAU 45394]|nr:hypothetical protein [Bradyrhizobium sp. CCBAU 45394]